MMKGSSLPEDSSLWRKDIDVSGIFIRTATTTEDYERVIDVRWEGYKGYFKKRDDVLDPLDLGRNSTLLLATDSQNRTVGTMRLLDRREGPIELENFLDVDSILPEKELACVEITRFTVPYKARASAIKLCMYKSVFTYCLSNGIDIIVISTIPALAHMYQELFFKDVGDNGSYHHNILGGVAHRTMKLNVKEIIATLKMKSPWLYEVLKAGTAE